jgi:monoamine oxidase
MVKEEGADRRGRPFQRQTCDFDKGPDFYFNAGPGRIPQSHTAILHYCKKLKVKLQPYIFACRSNLLQNDNFNHGKPVPLRWIKHDLRGHIAELLAHAARSDEINHIIAPGNQAAFLRMVQRYGNLKGSNQSLKYSGTSRGGYEQKPGAGLSPGVLRSPFDLNDLLESEFWQTGLFSDMYLYWQTSLMQAEGGMDHIPKAFRDRLDPKTQIQLNAKATGISQTADKIFIKHSKSEAPIKADYCISTMAPALLSRMLDVSFSPSFKAALANIYMVPACKVGWQAKSRFWEEKNEIYGGISWTRHVIKQMWYPSHGFHSPKGILTGAYNYGTAARIFGLMSLEDRMDAALAGGEKFHPNLFKRNVEKGISIAWQNMPNQAGGWAYYKDQAENPAYLTINKPQGRLVLAGDYFSFLCGWMEGAVRSAELAVNLIADMAGV